MAKLNQCCATLQCVHFIGRDPSLTLETKTADAFIDFVRRKREVSEWSRRRKRQLPSGLVKFLEAVITEIEGDP